MLSKPKKNKKYGQQFNLFIVSTNRYYKGSKYSEFVLAAKRGDKLLQKVINDTLRNEKLTGNQKNKLTAYMNSNEFISNFEVHFKYKQNLAVLYNAQRNSKSKKNSKVKGDIVEAYICWLHTNFGNKKVVDYIYNQIIKLSK